MRDLLVLQALEVAMLVHAVHHCAALWFYPALGHKVQLYVHIYSLHLGVIVIISGEAGVPKKAKDSRVSNVPLQLYQTAQRTSQWFVLLKVYERISSAHQSQSHCRGK